MKATLRACAGLYVCLLCSMICVGQNIPYGTTMERHQYDSINLVNLSITVTAPVLHRGGPVPESAWFTNTFNMQDGPNGNWQDGDSSEGVVLLFQSSVAGGYISYSNVENNVDCGISGGTRVYASLYTNPIYHDASGSGHPLSIKSGSWSFYSPQWPGTICVDSFGSGYTGDGTGFYANGYTVTDRSGNTFEAGIGIGTEQGPETDSNGNVASLTTTSLGQSFLATVTGGFQYNDASGNPRQVTVTNTSAPYRTNFGCKNGPVDNDVANGSFPTSVNFPDLTALGFVWESTPGFTGSYTGRLSQLILPTGGTITYGYSGGDAPGPGTGVWCTTPSVPGSGGAGVVPVLTRMTSEGTWTYTTYYNSPNAQGLVFSTTTVTDPSGNNVVYTFSGVGSMILLGNFPILVQKQVYQGGGIDCSAGCSTNNLLATTTYCYNNLTTFANCANPLANPINNPHGDITEEDVYTTLPGITGSSEVATSFDTYGNISSVKQYDFGVSSPTLIKNIAYGSYSSGSCAAVSVTINDRPCEITISDGTNISSDTRYTYDSKGNALTISSLVSGTPTTGKWLTNSITHNNNGTVKTATDAVGMVTTFGYNSTGGCNSLLPTSGSVGSATTVFYTTYATYDCLGGDVLTTTDANGNATTNSYTANGADPFYSIKSITGPLGETLSMNYTPTSTESSLFFNGYVQTAYAYVDAMGRHSKEQILRGTSYDTVNQTYGWGTSSNGAPAPFGPLTASTSIPCSKPLGSACGSSPVITTYLDAAGRTSRVAGANGGTIVYTYIDQDVLTQIGPAPTGENLKQVQTEYDGLGRVKSVCQILSAGGSSCGQAAGGNGYVTTFANSLVLGGSKVVATKGVQIHTSVFDGLGRLTSNTTPESGTIQYIYDSQTSACGSNSSAGDLVETIDNAGNTVCYARDILHRVTGISIAGQSSDCIGFYYGDQPLGTITPPAGWLASTANGNGRVVAAWTNSTCAGRQSIVTDEWFSYDAEGNVTTTWELTPHSGGYYQATAGYLANGVASSLTGIPGYTAMTYGFDANAKPISASEGSTPVVSGVTYTPSGQPLTISIGNAGGDTSNYGYDPNTGRMTNWTFTVGSTPQSQTGTLNWSSNGTLRSLTINDAFNAGGTQTCNFGTSSVMGYDDEGRLLSANCGSVWSQTFSYDEYDNLTQAGSAAWACAACYNSANNQYNSTLSSSIAYDANGRLTNDTFQKYQWNSYGQLSGTIAATGGTLSCGSSGSCYTYDAFGRMVEKSLGSAYSEILYSPLGKTATMSGQVTSSSYLPLPGGGTLYSTGTAGTNRLYQHKDWLGSVRVESSVGARSITYDRAFAPYGEMYDNFGVTTQLNFTGDTQEFDPSSNLFDTPNRELHTGQGRWISPDPSGAGWNAYSYSANPNSQTDPSGLCAADGGDGTNAPALICLLSRLDYADYDVTDANGQIVGGGCLDCIAWRNANGYGTSAGTTYVYPYSYPGSVGNFNNPEAQTLFQLANPDWGPNLYGNINGHAPGWVLDRLNHISAATTIGSGTQNSFGQNPYDLNPYGWSLSWQLGSSASFLGHEVNGVWDVTGGSLFVLGKSVFSGEAEKNIATTVGWAFTSPSKMGDALKWGGHEVAQTVQAAASGDPHAIGQVVGTAATVAYSAENVRVLEYKSGGGGLNIYDTPTTGSRMALDFQRLEETGGAMRPHVDITIKKPGLPSGPGSNLINIKHWPW